MPLEAYQEGIELFRQQKIKEALAKFEAAIGFWSKDKVSEIYRQRCDNYLETGAPEHIASVARLDEK